MAGEDLDGKKKLERMNKLLGTDHFDKKSSKADKTKAPPPPPEPKKDEPVEDTSSDKNPVSPEEKPEPSVPVTPPSSTQSPTVPQSGAVTPTLNTQGTTMGQPGPVTPVLNTQDANAAPSGPVPVSVRVLPWEEHVTPPPVDAHPKVSWGMRVSIETYDFIKAHDSVRLQLQDKRTFKEKLSDWMEELKAQVTSELKPKPPEAPSAEKKEGADSKTQKGVEDSL
jgi:hypothetical protein